MSTYQVRQLHCLPCDQPVRVRNEVIDGIEVLSRCPECDGHLVDIGRLDLSARLKPNYAAWYYHWTLDGMSSNEALARIWHRCDEEGC